MTRMAKHPSRRSVGLGLTAGGLATGFGRLPAHSEGQPEADGETILRAAPARQALWPEAREPADLWLLNGRTAPPVVSVRHGEEVRVRLVNDTPAPLSLHWHGVRGANAMDGVGGLTQAQVAPGASFSYRFTPPDPGTFLVRPMVPGRSGEPAGRGLAAVLVVQERDPPPIDAEFALVVRDWLATETGTLASFGDPREAALAGRLGNRLVVEGADAPRRIELAAGSRVRLRLANACNARIMRIRFDGLKVYVAAIDGQPTETFEPLRATLPFAPGTRYDLIFDLAAELGKAGAITALVGAGIALAEIRTIAAAAVPARRPAIAPLAPNRLLPPEIKLQNALRQDVVIAGGASRNAAGEPAFPPPGQPVWTVNGAPGSATARALVSAKRGQPVVLGITNRTGFPQPLHIHGHVVRLLHPLDDGWEPYWLDTFQVPEGRTVHVAFLADNPGRWMLGSTVLERLDAGLWTWFEVL